MKRYNRILLLGFSFLLGALLHIFYKIFSNMQRYPKASKIAISVIGLHTAIVIWGFQSSNGPLKKKIRGTLTVHMMKELIQPKSMNITRAKTHDSFPLKKQNIPPPKNHVSAQHKKKALIKKIDECLSNIDKSHLIKKTSLPIPHLSSSPTNLENDKLSTTNEFYEKFKAFLSQNVSFPNKGEIKTKLTVNEEGAIVNFEIISGNNQENEEYLKKILPTLKGPCFNKEQMQFKTLTIYATFSSE